MEAGLVKSVLDGSSIENFAHHSNFAGLYPGMFETKIFVRDEDVEKAAEIIRLLFSDSFA